MSNLKSNAAHSHSRALPLVYFLSGLMFGLGLVISGMTNPAKVIAFLNLKGPWDPSLALVMAAAIAVALPAFTWAKTQPHSLLGPKMQLPHNRQLDKRLLLGALTFGAGWGLAGFCPGPALVAAATGMPKALIFTTAMLAGMGLFEILERTMHTKINNKTHQTTQTLSPTQEPPKC